MKTIALALIISLLLPASNAFAQETAQWRKVAEAIPLGTKVKIHRQDGTHISGTLTRVDDETVQVKRNTRRPEPATPVPFADITHLQRDDQGGLNWAKALGIGFAAGAGAILTAFMIALSLDGS